MPNKVKEILDNEGIAQAKIVSSSGLSPSTINRLYTKKNGNPSEVTKVLVVKAINTIVGENKYTKGSVFQERDAR